MNWRYPTKPYERRWFIPFGLVFALGPLLGASGPATAGERNNKTGVCFQTVALVYRACNAELEDDRLIARAGCLNQSRRSDRRECEEEAQDEREEGRISCRQQYRARRAVCRELDESRYDPRIDSANFVDPADIGSAVTPNPYFPLVPGNRWVYRDAGEEITVVVTEKTKLIEGVQCRVVTDVVTENGAASEITEDWFAQDRDGNVWYFGEISRELETFAGDNPSEPEIVDIEGSWKAGRDRSKPGVVMLGSPQVGRTYREEMSLGEAEDLAEVVSITGSESVPAGSCAGNCVVTRNFTPLEPGVEEEKYYAPGIGLILELGRNGKRVELIEFGHF